MSAPHHAFRALPLAVLAGLLGLTLVAAGARSQVPEMSATGAAVATGSGLLETTIRVERLVAPGSPDQGPARFEVAERVAAGDELHYTIRVRNPGAEPVTEVQVTKRMPQGVQYIEGSATGPACDVEFSSDGGSTFAARPGDPRYTHLRWTLHRPLPGGATALLRFRATFR